MVKLLSPDPIRESAAETFRVKIIGIIARAMNDFMIAVVRMSRNQSSNFDFVMLQVIPVVYPDITMTPSCNNE